MLEKTDDLDTLFGSNHALRRHDRQSMAYELTAFEQEVWNLPQAYRTIYQPQDAALAVQGATHHE